MDERAFSAGREAVIAGRYDEGRSRLRHYLAQHAEGDYASRAQFFVAKSFLGEGDLGRAKAAFAATINRFPSSLEAKKSRDKLALIALLRGDRQQARTEFARVAGGEANALRPEAAAMSRWLTETLARTERAER
ncbi:MAG: tetratricopeptide repeat protein [Pseudomonadota bacterium]